MLRFLAIAFVANCALALNVRPLTTPRHAISGCRAAIYLDEAAVEPSAIEKAMEMKAPKAKSKRINKKKASYIERLKGVSPEYKGRAVAQAKREKAASDAAAAEAKAAAAEAAAAAEEAAAAEAPAEE